MAAQLLVCYYVAAPNSSSPRIRRAASLSVRALTPCRIVYVMANQINLREYALRNRENLLSFFLSFHYSISSLLLFVLIKQDYFNTLFTQYNVVHVLLHGPSMAAPASTQLGRNSSRGRSRPVWLFASSSARPAVLQHRRPPTAHHRPRCVPTLRCRLH
jgi:hypothetical protein